MQPVFDPRLQDEIPGWVIDNILQVSAWMKSRGHKTWSVGGIGPLPELPAAKDFAPTLCKECGQPTMHLGDLCFSCGKAERISVQDISTSRIKSTASASIAHVTRVTPPRVWS